MKIKKTNEKKQGLKNCLQKDDRKWKEGNHKYLSELQLFFDRVEEIKDLHLKQDIISQMLQCDKALTEIAEEMFYYYYEQGYQKAKEE